MARKAKPGDAPALPTPEAILDLVKGAPGKVGKREIARAFGITGGDKISLKRVLREMEESGQLAGRKNRLRRPGDLPAVTLLAIDGVDDGGDPVGTPVEWEEDWGPAPRIPIAPDRTRGKRRDAAPGSGDRVLARLVASGDGGGFTARVIKVLERRRTTVVGTFQGQTEKLPNSLVAF